MSSTAVSERGTAPRPAAFITGAAGGIGRAVALEFARTHNLVVTDRDPAGLLSTQHQASLLGAQTVHRSADVTDENALRELLAEARTVFGPVTNVVACAGIAPGGTVETTSLDDWHRVLAVNLTGTFVTARVSISSLRETRGSFIAIASDAGTFGAQDLAAYVASKHGVVGLVKSLALDFGAEGIRSNAICPGFVETPMMRQIFDESPAGTEEYYRNAVPTGRFAKPGEIAKIARHLTESNYANGITYAVDGGSTAGYYRAPHTS
ncbi:SDR family NAD(P)-dependent oxidoreductase [Cryobacterium sp. TMT2-23]|uniref:SDR family NAD(P)-dependent oxidoreductase n=1 Tax=Cryobacterium sp. TMT2-23 TaxID=1259252 RepID=UPI00106B9CE9|nr:SDR family oxidoreductase [Cryobacterium sp. TMT2-23]TFD29119.1 SDR family oxidoreductase [Cryobacterium sp. TMT2-23]